ncbi:MAG TPA: diacylglycerol kinase [Bacteroidetes bacterium]|jgi:diacylglycerol kinase|nr:diacylglycerol kinase [Bacteroidota bacterium]
MYPKLVTYICFMLMQQIRAFGYAINGIGLFFWKERHAKIHAVASFFIIALSYYFSITSSEWLWVLLCITLVIVTEMINTAIERLCNKLSTEIDLDIKIIKDVSAGFVLISSLFAVAVAAIIFSSYLL